MHISLVSIKCVDVVLCTYNSNKPYFEKCLKSIKQEIPLNRLIVIDKSSKDGTLGIIRKHFPDSLIIQSEASLAEARKIGIDNVKTEYFAFVDDDIELCSNWFSTLIQNINSNVGAIHGTAYPIWMPRNSAAYKWLLWAEGWAKRRGSKNIVDIDKGNLSKRIRGYTHNTIVLTDSVKDWKPPRNIQAYEDWLIQKYIVSKGYIWRILRNLRVNHFAPIENDALKDHFKKLRWNSAGARITGFKNWEDVLGEDIKVMLKSFKASVDFRDPRIMLYVLTMVSNYTKGYLKWNKYNILKR